MADLIVQFASTTRPETGASACGVIVTDARSARPIHESGDYLGDCPSAQDAAFAGLLKVLETLVPLSPESVELQCTNEWLVRQVTGAAPIESPAQIDLYEQVIGHLLRLDSWRISVSDVQEIQRAVDLAERAVTDAAGVSDLDVESAAQTQHEKHTGIPQWTVQLLDDPGPDCPARCRTDRKYAFGPDMPAGFCVHAGIVALTDGPLTWTDPQQKRMTTVCPHCDATLRIDLVRD